VVRVKINSDRKPSFERLLDVLWNEEPDLIPFYEHFVDDEVVEAANEHGMSLYFTGIRHFLH